MLLCTNARTIKLTTNVTKIITSLPKGGSILVVLVSLSVCKQHYSKGYEWIAMKFHGEVGGG